MINVLLTSAPMIRRVDQYSLRFQQCNLNVEIPIMENRQILTENELINLIPKYDVWIVGDDNANYNVLQAGRSGNLKIVIKWGVGIDNIDRKAIDDLKLKFDYTPAMFGNEVADVALGYLLCLSRSLHTINNKVKAGIWYKPCGISLYNKNVYLLGFGDIGRNIAKRLVSFGLKLYICDPFFSRDSNTGSINYNGLYNPNIKIDQSVQDNTYDIYQDINNPDSLKALQNSDFLIICCILNESTFHAVNQNILNHCKNGIKIINVSRGPIIDESALIDALEFNKISSVALDVFEKEPLSLESNLRKSEYDDRTIFGSHNSSNTMEAVDATSNLVIDKIIGFL